MKIVEKILLLIWLLTLLLHAFGQISYMYYTISTIFLSGFYFFGGFKLFQPKDQDGVFVSTLAGIVIAISLFTIPFEIRLRNDQWLSIIPIVAMSFTFLLLISILWNRLKKKNIPPYQKSILWRLLPTLVISCFLAYSPITSNLYRSTLIFLNKDHTFNTSYLKAYDYLWEAENHLEEENCQKATELAHKSLKEGLKIYPIDRDTMDKNGPRDLRKVHGPLSCLYNAYTCIATLEKEHKNYTEALYLQLKADSFLNLNQIPLNDQWRNQRAISLNNIGRTYQNLYNHENAILYYLKAIEYHTDSIGTPNSHLSTYLNNLAESLEKVNSIEKSNAISLRSIQILNEIDSSDEHLEKYTTAYFQLIRNALIQGDLSKVDHLFNDILPYLKSGIDCREFVYKAIFKTHKYQFQTGIDLSKKAIHCFEEKYDQRHQNIAESSLLLSELWSKIPNYDSAFFYLQSGKEITEFNYGISSRKYHDFVAREGRLQLIMGQLSAAKKSNNQAITYYEKHPSDFAFSLLSSLLTMGQIYVLEMQLEKVDKIAGSCLKIIEQNGLFQSNRSKKIFNELAYLYYATDQEDLADSLYQHSASLNYGPENDSNLVFAETLNGLGLIASKNASFQKADSLFNRALAIYNHAFSGHHPEKAIVLLNQSTLNIKRGNLQTANSLITKSFKNFTSFHKKMHPTFGDLHSTKASILAKLGKDVEAKLRWRIALKIYESNFHPQHKKILALKKKLEASGTSKSI